MATSSPRFSLPSLNLSLRWRITLPFLLLAFGLGLGAAYLVLRVFQESAEDRFLRQLAAVGQQTADAVVALERDLLEVERLVENSAGLAQDVQAEDAEALRAQVLPLALNAEVDAVTVVNGEGVSLLSARSILDGGPGSYETVRGEAFYASWPFVAEVLAMEPDSAEKRIGLGVVQMQGVDLPVMFVVGPVPGGRSEVVGAIMVGHYLEGVVAELARASGANVTAYSREGGPLLASTLEFDPQNPFTLPQAWAQEALNNGEGGTPVRKMEFGGVAYREALLPFVGRGGEDRLGVLGVSLLDTVREQAGASPGPRTETVQWVVGFGALGLLLIGAVGLGVSNSIARPLEEIARATDEIAQGNLDIEVPEQGGGEVTVVARSFNEMVRGLREAAHGEHPAAATRLPAAGAATTADRSTLPLPDSETVELTLLALEIRLRPDSEESTDGQIASAYDAVLAVVQQAIERHRGELLSFDGLHGLAAFGLSGERQPAPVQALLASHAACEIADRLAELDVQRRVEGRRGVTTALAVHAGEVLFGDIGEKYGLATRLLGDTVVIAQELLGPARQAGEGSILVSDRVRSRLGASESHFQFGRRGVAAVRSLGRDELVHEIEGRQHRLIGGEEEGEGE
ncbi:MAG: cache domain-containing protein [Anaerolineales bacterium]|nr:cache domain-containing protein [Anaerolineales bacterium]